MSHIIGYAFDADLHCEACTEKRFGIDEYPYRTVVDSEGNNVHPMFDHDSDGYEHGAHCGDCGGEISEPWCDGCPICIPAMALEGYAYIANPGDADHVGARTYGKQTQCFLFEFGAYGDTRVIAWGWHLEDALEAAAECLAEKAPGHLIAHDSDELQELVGEAMEGLECDEDTQTAAFEKATEGLTYTEPGYLTSHEWFVRELSDLEIERLAAEHGKVS